VPEQELYDDIFDELYERAVPGIEEIETTEYPDDVNLPYLHFIEGEEMEEVIEDYCNEYDVPGHQVMGVKKDVVLGKSPSTSLNVVDNAREDADLEPVSDMLEGGTE